ncbi:hypothetical protein [Yersinia similis]|uniref:hypothetical protein n=1 Tax=Yersinia similis TaxID=367190 RepID=UPI0011A77987|nr:hypothetical protein [Yersinia similis]
MLFDTDIFDPSMADVMAKLSFSSMNTDDRLQLADYCDEARTGLCHCLDYLGDSLITFSGHNVLEFTPTSLYQLGHSLNTINSLKAALTQLEQLIRADIQNMDPQPTDICM